MEREKIHFTGQPFITFVEWKGNERIKCIPIVYESRYHCGIGVLYKNGQKCIWGLLTPRNIIAAWRGTEILHRLGTIKSGTLCEVYFTGVRNPSKFDKESYIEPIIARIGERMYEKIMSLPVPEQIIRAILDNQKEDFHPDLYPITDEVRAGTIQWRQEFADAGVIHPDEVDAKERTEKEIITRCEPLLDSYAKSRRLPRHCLCMNYVESVLLTLVEKGANKTNSDSVLVALAGVVGDIAISTMSMGLAHYSQKEYESQANNKRNQATSQSAKWLALSSRRFFFFKKRDLELFTEQKAWDILTKMFTEYFPMESETIPV